jgi:phosphohistidine phosphatase SixA
MPWWQIPRPNLGRFQALSLPRRATLVGFSLAALTISLVIVPALAADDSKDAWDALVKGGHIALIRHGNAPPGFGGDPPGFRFDDCKTQRNLDDKGRAQGKALGEAFRSHGVRVDRIVSSPVCRCIDTASLMAVGQVESSWALVPDRDPSAPVRLRELKEIVSNWRGPGTLVLVTHGFTIRPLIGMIPEQAETVVLRPPTPGIESAVHVVGRIAPPQ